MAGWKAIADVIKVDRNMDGLTRDKWGWIGMILVMR
jgi:hypothetical protein